MATLVVDDEKCFVSDDWMGQGKIYDMPWEALGSDTGEDRRIQAARARRGTHTCRQRSRYQICSLGLPRQSSELAYGQNQLWFSKDEPTTTLVSVGL